MISLVTEHSKQQFIDEYEINQTFGFLPLNEPLKRLCHYYSQWELLLDDLADLIKSNKLRQLIKRLPVLSTNRLTNVVEFRRAFVVLSFLTHAYVFGHEDQETLEVLPKCLAVPYCLVANHLKMRPVVCASAVCLWNYSVIDEDKPIELDNLKINHRFTHTRDEEWFYLITTGVELLGGQCITSAINLLSLLTSKNINKNELISLELNKLTKLIQKINVIMLRMYDYCDPKVFYTQIRRFLSGWLNMEEKGLPRGLYYEGTENLWIMDEDSSNCWRKFAGGSAGQAPLIQFLDIFLGIDHYPTLKEWKDTYLHESNTNKKPYVTYLMKMREYMSGGHRQLLFDLSEIKNNMRNYVTNINQLTNENKTPSSQNPIYAKEIVDNYNMCVNGMKSFRNIHLQMVSRYIVMQSAKNKATPSHIKNSNLNATHNVNLINNQNKIRGTGGTDLIPFLKQCRDETSIKLINKQ